MPSRNTSPQSGFALILALLTLLLLTTMGLALSNSASTELQISSNHRWTEAARFNAEGGIEYGRSLLVTANWPAILPPARVVADWLPTTWNGTATATTGSPVLTRATRNFENWKCDARGFGMGYGVVFDDGGAQGPEEYRTAIGGSTMNGAFTLWVRRPVRWNGALGTGTGTNLEDYTGNDALILVSEGVAPYAGANNTTRFGASNRAVYTMETLLIRTGNSVTDSTSCGSRQGQAGGSQSGNNSAGCVALGGPGSGVSEALTGVAGVNANITVK